ncbi:MAG: threonine synthase [Anaerolineales bacterium]
MFPWPGVIARYRDQIDLPVGAAAVTLLEGNTPLIPVPRLAKSIGAGELYIKFEGLNPTGSFKDRGMTVAVSEAAYRGAETMICASTGNTAASAAAYAARAGMRCLVLIPEGQVAVGKLAGAIAYGADVIQINGSFDDALDMVRQSAESFPLAIVNSINPYRLEGQKTVAFEITEALGQPPDWLVLPVGNAGNISAAWMGFTALHHDRGMALPQLLGVQAAGAAPLVDGHPIDQPKTIATAIKIGRPARGDQALSAAADSGGRIIAASDEQILEAQRLLAGEGIWVEPASAAGVAGLKMEIAVGRLDAAEARIVAICTGHGMKDPSIVTDQFPAPIRIEADVAALEGLIQQ